MTAVHEASLRSGMAARLKELVFVFSMRRGLHSPGSIQSSSNPQGWLPLRHFAEPARFIETILGSM